VLKAIEIVALPNLLCYSNIVVPDRVHGDSKVYIRPIMLQLGTNKALNWIELILL
jgi:hypothetical protein